MQYRTKFKLASQANQRADLTDPLNHWQIPKSSGAQNATFLWNGPIKVGKASKSAVADLLSACHLLGSNESSTGKPIREWSYLIQCNKFSQVIITQHFLTSATFVVKNGLAGGFHRAIKIIKFVHCCFNIFYVSNSIMCDFGIRVVKRNRPVLNSKMKGKKGRNSVSPKTARSPWRKGNLAQKF